MGESFDRRSVFPEGDRPTWAWPLNNTCKADSPLQSSGLLGPVVLMSVIYND